MKKIQIAVVILFCLSIAGNVFLLSGCKSFEPVIMEGQPDECNDFYSILKYYSVEGKDSAFVGTVYNECKIARAEKRNIKIKDLCKQLYFPDSEINKKSYEVYSQYLECLK